MESVAYRFSLVADLLRPEMTANHIFIAGGGAITNSPWWLQTMADVLQAEIHVPTEEQATSRGAAILALNALGSWQTLNVIPPHIAKNLPPARGTPHHVPNGDRATGSTIRRRHRVTVGSSSMMPSGGRE